MAYDFLTEEERAAFAPNQIANKGDLRQLRIFISHRWDHHDEVYPQICEELHQSFGRFQDLSIPEHRKITGERGGYLDQFELKANMAARIYASDIILCLSNVGMGMRPHTKYEIQMAAVAYSVPLIFIRLPEQRNMTQIVNEADNLGVSCQIATLGSDELVVAVQEFVTKEMLRKQYPMEASIDASLAQRGPSDRILDDVFREFPYLKFTATMDVFSTDAEKRAQDRRRRMKKRR